MIASALIDSARSRLGDEAKHRWTDSRLLHILDAGQKDFCKISGIHRRVTALPVGDDVMLYALPNDCITVNRLEYLTEIIPLFSRNDIDEVRVSGKEFVGIKDNLGMRFIQLYPAPPTVDNVIDIRAGVNREEEFKFSSPWGVVTNINGDYNIDPIYGVITGAYFTLDDLSPNDGFGEIVDSSLNDALAVKVTPEFGVTIAIDVETEGTAQYGFVTSSEIAEVIGRFGVVTDIVNEDGYVRLFYTAMPATLKTLRDELILHDLWEAAMIRYIVGTALQDDNDANNIQRGEMELGKYMQEVAKAKELTSKDFSRGQKDKLTTRFRRI